MRSKIIIASVILACILTTWLFARLYQELMTAYEQSGSLMEVEYSWLFRLLLNIGGYATVLLPGFILYKYLDRSNYFDKIGNSTHLSRILHACFGEPTERLPESIKPTKVEESTTREGVELAFCFTGLMGAYLVWGLLQEKIMTQSYLLSDGTVVKFDDSQFLVFINRLLAFLVALGRLLCTQQPLVSAPLYKFSYCSVTNIISAWCQYEALKYVSFPTQCDKRLDLSRNIDKSLLVFINRLPAFLVALGRLVCTQQPLVSAPLYKFSYCSVTNIISAWCQYEALKYVSFPTQVLSKSCKVIPVMMMGKLISRTKYELYEYVTAVMISVGMVLFMFGSHDDYSVSTVTTMSGLTLLALYMVCDSFTSSWQGALFARYSCSALQMLCGVNLFSCALTAAALAHHTTTQHSLTLLQHPVFAMDCLLLSVSSAVGQLLIYRTIARFGAVVFTIIMTLRQAVSILLSCAVYGHVVSLGGFAGVALVFAAALLRVYCRRRLRARRQREVHA